jgi:erythritol transport system ATP-binding protein
MTQPALLAARGISKQFPGTLALDRVDFTARAGQVSAVVGENGAGKSTLMRILAGIDQPTYGGIQMDGRPVRLASTRDAASLGIAMIHQELNLLPDLSVTDNIFLGRELTRRGIVDRKAEEQQTRHLLQLLNQPIEPQALAGSLPTGQQQAIEIARAIAQDVRVLIMDEPTSALSAAEIEVLFRVIRDLKSRGVAVIYISHHLEEVLAIADNVTVLRDGRVVAEAAAASIGVNWIVEKMTGGALPAPTTTPAPSGAPLFTAEGISLEGELDDVSLFLHAGEIVGLYGLLGAGRTPLLESIAGLRSPIRGEMRLNGARLARLSVAQRIAAGISLVPESRQRDALVPYLSVRENIMLASRSGWYVSLAAERRRAAEIARELRIRMGDLENPVTSLSGGNQQKVILARYLLTSPKLLLMDEPTCGVDIGARAEIFEIVRRLASQGMAVLFASSELQEVMALATRIVVMASGRITAQFTSAEASEDALVAAASPLGGRAAGGEHAYR